MKNYKKVKKISQGAFGTVFQYQNLKTDGKIQKRVAVKQLHNTANLQRQLQIWKSLPKHQNLIQLYEVIKQNFSTSIVMELGLSDISTWILKKQYPIQEKIVKKITKQILQGLQIFHEKGYIHRDLKPGNIIIKKNGKLALCDFGSAVKCSNGFTRWYKAPQMLFGSRKYHYEVDIWSLGCIIMQIATGEPYFCGKSQIQQLSLIAHELGDPVPKNWPSIVKLPDYKKIQFKPLEPKTTQLIAKQRSISLQLATFIKKMIRYEGRSSVNQLLNDLYLKDTDTIKLQIQSEQDQINIIRIKQTEKFKKIMKEIHKQ